MKGNGARVIAVNAQNLPWVLIGLLLSAVLAVFYGMLRGHIVPRSVSDQMRESAEKRAEVAEAGVKANTDTVESLVESVGKLMILAENQDRVLHALREASLRGWHRGGTS
jgi:uncharacterized sporulation protein YeaH/YhbH (DUF444 family)